MLKAVALVSCTAIVTGTVASAVTANCILKFMGREAIVERLSTKLTNFVYGIEEEHKRRADYAYHSKYPV